jgi:cation/acetate symporter
VYGWYTGGLSPSSWCWPSSSRWAVRERWIGFIFLLATVLLYAGIGIMSRTTTPAEYYVAGRRVPAIYNGMATAPTGCRPPRSSAWPEPCT